MFRNPDVSEYPPTHLSRGECMTHHHTDLSEAAILGRVTAWMDRTGSLIPGMEVPHYLGIARSMVTINGHVQWRTHRLRLVGIDDPGIERLMLLEAYADNMAERHPGSPPGLFLP